MNLSLIHLIVSLWVVSPNPTLETSLPDVSPGTTLLSSATLDLESTALSCDRTTDSLALVDLYNSTNGTEWNSNIIPGIDKWLSETDPINLWSGVTTTDGCVVQIELPANNLTGSLPNSIGNITNLRFLYLGNNSIGGSLPEELGNLGALQVLEIWENQLSGEIPANLWNSPNLVIINLENNNLSGALPDSISKLTTLQQFYVRDNQLSGALPTDLGDLGITGVDFGNNQFNGCFPDSYMAFCGLTAGFKEFDGNIGLSFGGDFTQFCAMNPQVGTSCNDSNNNTINDLITADCRCIGTDTSAAGMDSLALVAFYNAMGGASWTDNTNWLTGASLDTWVGITRDGDNRVTTIILNNNNLIGTLPSEIGNLTKLEHLELAENQVSGTIPAEIGSLSLLKNLLFPVNQITVPLPTELGTLSNLEMLDLSSNQIAGALPSEILSLTNLENLYLGDNQINGSIPTSLASITNLKVLDLSSNQFTGSIPDEIGNLTGLITFSLYNNQITGSIPNELGNLVNLTFFDLSANQIDGSIPAELGNLTNAVTFFIYDNQITGSIPNELGNLASVENLYLNDNQITGSVPNELGSLSNLVDLNLAFNQLEGALPAELGDLSSLTQLLINDNNLSGCFPDEYSIFCGITSNFTNNPGLSWGGDFTRYCTPESQTGATCDDGNVKTVGDSITMACLCIGMDTSAAALDSLALVALYNATGGASWTSSTNWLTSNPLSTWQGVTLDGDGRLINLDLENNNLTGSLPADIGQWSKLEGLTFGGNTIGGNIPAEIGDLTAITSIQLNLNNFSGAIPSEIGNLTNLSGLLLNSNNLLGGIPSEIGNLTKLEYLKIHGNPLGGSIPGSIGNLTQLIELDLQSSQLTGPIPSEIGNLTNLQILSLSNNTLNGDLPVELGDLNSIEGLELFQNQFTGSIPTELSTLTTLNTLNLYENQLSGNIPTSLGSLPNLIRLDLSNNMLDGEIPIELGNLSTLQQLFLDDNQLTGALPVELSNLTLITSFEVQNNMLSGCFPDEYSAFCGSVYDFSNNPGLSWGGDFSRFCTPEDQVGATCDDGNPATINDAMTADCNCIGLDTTLCSVRDSLVLVDFYNATNGASWTTTWDLNQPMSTWNGVSLSGEGCVTALNLGNNNLVGSLPLEFGNLEDLSFLSIETNKLSGALPASIGNLSQLNYLNIRENDFTGTLPTEFANLQNLETVILGRNEFTSAFPDEIYALSSLKVFSASAVTFSPTQISGAISNLTNLESFTCDACNLTGSLPSEMGTLSNLKDINMPNNSFTGNLPSEWGSLVNLEFLALRGNQLDGSIPDSFRNLINMQRFLITTNQFSGEVPDYLTTFANLQDLDFGMNNFSGSIPLGFGNLSQLQFLRLYDNTLVGSLPNDLGESTSLQELELQNNQLEGCFPSSYSVLCGITTNFSGNASLSFGGDFSRFCAEEQQGSASCDFGNPKFSDFTIMADCSCEGILDTTACAYRDSVALVSFYNTFDGDNWVDNTNWLSSQSIDTWKGIQTDTSGCVTNIQLRNNNIAGLATDLDSFNLEELKELDFIGNALTGPLPDFQSFPKLGYLDLSQGMITGTIPDFSGFPGLYYLALNLNQLEGPIVDFTNLPNLGDYLIEGNQLTGTIPDFQNLPVLYTLDLDGNNLNGSIPDFSGLPGLRILHASITSLSGTIPDFSNLPLLERLQLHDNDLTGNIPDFSNLPNLVSLQLYNNQLEGTLPEWAGSPNISEVNISNNLIEGCFPASFTRFCGQTANFTGNAKLAWEGDLTNFCNADDQNGATCDDGDPLTNLDLLNADCLCIGIDTTACSYKDSVALVTFYNAFDGANWTDNTNWLSTEPIGNWFGVTADLNSCVTRIELTGNNLSGGTIILESLAFDSLQVLALSSNNALSGTIVDYPGFPNLEELSLNDIALTGSIPDFQRMPRLRVLNLAATQVTGPLPDFSGLPQLEFLSLVNTVNVGGNIPNFTNTPKLKHLDLAVCSMTGSIPDLSNIPLLEYLSLSSNGLSGGFPDLSVVPNLTHLLLGENPLTGIMPDLSNRPTLEVVALKELNLTGSIANWSNLPSLVILDLSYNQLTGSIPPLLNSTNLGTYMLEGNQLSGLVPDLSHMTMLKDLEIQENAFTFEDLTPQLSAITAIIAGNSGSAEETYTYAPQDSITSDTMITLEVGMDFDYSVSTDAGLMDNMYTWYKDGGLLMTQSSADFQVSNLSLGDAGTYRFEITNTGASDLTLFSRKIILDVISSCRQRDSLILVDLYNATDGANWINTWDLNQPMDTWFGVSLNGGGCVISIDTEGENNLVGTLPESLGNLSELLSFKLYANPGISGPIPSSIGRLSKLNHFWVSGNNHSGTLPDSLFMLNELQEFYINENINITGNLPDGIGNLVNLRSLELGSTGLSGPIPNSWSNLTALRTLSMADIAVGTVIPDFIGNLTNLEILTMGGCQLSGTIPANFCNLINLKSLSLLANNLEGTISSCLLDLPLVGLYLGGNNFSGEFPDNINGLTDLQFLDISFNNFSGSFSASFANLSKLEELDAQKNAFTDFPTMANPLLNKLYINDNKLTFEDVIPNNGRVADYIYAPQDSIFVDTTIMASVGEDFIIDLGIDPQEQNSYCWTKDGVPCTIPFNGSTYSFTNVSLEDAGEYTATVTNLNALDLTLQSRKVTIVIDCPVEAPQTDLVETVCTPDTYDFNGQILDQSGEYLDTVQTAAGCDSIISLTLTVNQSFSTQLDTTLCADAVPLLIGGQSFSESGDFMINLQTQEGCDSIINLSLVLIQVEPILREESLCQGDSIEIEGIVFKETIDTTIQKMDEVFGCNFDLIIRVEVTPSILTVLDSTICSGESVQVGNSNYSTTGNFEDRFTAVAGCDSIVQLNLTVNNAVTTQIDTVLCRNIAPSFTVGNETFTESGNFMISLLGSNGCDSTVNLTLTFNTVEDLSVMETVCEGESIEVAGVTYSNTIDTSYTEVDPISGCSRNIAVQLNVVASFEVAIDSTICPGGSVRLGNNTLTVPGVYEETFTAQSGCDSVVTLTLNIGVLDEPLVADAGLDTLTCSPDFTLSGNLPANTTGSWSSTSLGVIQDPNRATTIVNELENGVNTFIWTLRSEGNCPVEASDEVNITLLADQPIIRDDNLNLNVNRRGGTDIQVLDNDQLNNQYEWQTELFGPAKLGEVEDRGNGNFTYSTEVSGILADTFTYKVSSVFCPEDLFDIGSVFLNGGAQTEIRKVGFSPDGDGVNDEFVIPELVDNPERYPANELIIINRWGEIVYQRKPYMNEWKGTYKETDQLLPTGTYFFRITLSVGEKEIVEGQVTILRKKE